MKDIEFSSIPPGLEEGGSWIPVIKALVRKELANGQSEREVAILRYATQQNLTLEMVKAQLAQAAAAA